MNTRNQNMKRLEGAMKIVDRKSLDDVRWNKLVESTPGAGFFSYTWYLDTTAENWCALVDEDYKFGLALPFSVRFGVETLYTPIFVRYIELLGNGALKPAIEAIVKNRFRNINISIKQNLLGNNYQKFVYQTIHNTEDRKVNSQAKRMLNKAEKNEIIVSTSHNYSEVYNIIQKELSGKHSGLDEVSMKALLRLFEAAKSQGHLKVYEVSGKGGIVCLENVSQSLYLKGATIESVKSIGGMYALLNTSISSALDENRKFDFGGSRIEGVRRFNTNLGGVDVEYFNYKVDKTPFWFKFARRIKSAWKK